jgi:hypothetical protein
LPSSILGENSIFSILNPILLVAGPKKLGEFGEFSPEKKKKHYFQMSLKGLFD